MIDVSDWADVLQTRIDPAVVTDPALRKAIEATRLPWRVRDRATGIELLLIPPGSFVMGKSRGDSEAAENELPAHEVRLTSAFYLGRFEVTQAQWAVVMGSNPSKFQRPSRADRIVELMADGLTRAEADAVVAGEDFRPSAQLPVENIDWYECRKFCEKCGVRLPSEAEWEFSCRAGMRVPRYGSVEEVAWYAANAGGRPATVGGKSANAFGLHDMLGNVAEWVEDAYSPYSDDSQVDPPRQKLGHGDERVGVLRGGSWFSGAYSVRASSRDFVRLILEPSGADDEAISYRAYHVGNIQRRSLFGLRVARNP
jgi:sulfatase modifying factor 1